MSARHVRRTARGALPRQREEDRAGRGRDETATALAALPDGWEVLHDVGIPWGAQKPADHVVVGPTGVYAVDTLDLAGSVDLRDGQLWQGGRPRLAPFATTRRRADAVRRALGWAPHEVVPVVSLPGRGPLAEWLDDLLVVDPASLVDALTARPRTCRADQVEGLASRVARASGPGGLPTQRAARRSPRVVLAGPLGARARRAVVVASAGGLAVAAMAAAVALHAFGGDALDPGGAAWGEDVELGSGDQALRAQVGRPGRAPGADRWRSEVVVVNAGREPVRVDRLAWTLRARTGDGAPASVRVSSRAQVPEELAPGASWSTTLTWEVPRGATPTSVVLRDAERAARWRS